MVKVSSVVFIETNPLLHRAVRDCEAPAEPQSSQDGSAGALPSQIAQQDSSSETRPILGVY